MLGLDEEDGERVGMEGLDEEGKERLDELGEGEVEAVREEGREVGEWSGGDVGGEEVQFVKKGRWFTASVRGVTLPSEDVGQEVEKCFNAISCMSFSCTLPVLHHTFHHPLTPLPAQPNSNPRTFHFPFTQPTSPSSSPPCRSSSPPTKNTRPISVQVRLPARPLLCPFYLGG